MKSMKNDYLKYWRVIRQYVKVKYEISQSDLDILLFLYSEEYFGEKKYREYAQLVSWDRLRFNNMIKNDWIEVFRQGTTRTKTLYCLSFKSKRMITSIYKKLNGEEIPMTAENNPMFKKNVKYSDKVYRNMIKSMNAYTKADATERQQHHVPE